VRQPEAARLLGISKTTLLELIAEGRLEQVVLRENSWPLIRRADIEALARGDDPVPGRAASIAQDAKGRFAGRRRSVNERSRPEAAPQHRAPNASGQSGERVERAGP
jgi:excisionase family DNA binding protein